MTKTAPFAQACNRTSMFFCSWLLDSSCFTSTIRLMFYPPTTLWRCCLCTVVLKQTLHCGSEADTLNCNSAGWQPRCTLLAHLTLPHCCRLLLTQLRRISERRRPAHMPQYLFCRHRLGQRGKYGTLSQTLTQNF